MSDMQSVTVEIRKGVVHIYVGVVDASGNYQLLKCSTSEAAVLMMKLQDRL